MLSAEEVKKLDEACDKLVEHPKVRFAGVINDRGNMVAGDIKTGIRLYDTDARRKMRFNELVLEHSMRKEDDDILGSISFIASKREKVLMISIPMGEHLIIISAEPDSSVSEITGLCGKLFGL